MPDLPESDPSRVTLLLEQLSAGHNSAVDELLPLVYGELHRIARAFFRHQPPGHTLQPTALVNEAFIRFFKDAPPHLTGRAHFLALMARVMRQILVDHARAVATAKRRGRGKVSWDTNIEIHGYDGAHRLRVLEVHDALDALASENHSYAQVVEMHYFGGMTAGEIALATGKSVHIVQHELRFARAWLRRQMAAE